jgi:hypothetical protein
MARDTRTLRTNIRDNNDLIADKTHHREMTLEDILKLEAT